MHKTGKTAVKIAVFGVVCAILDVIFHAILTPSIISLKEKSGDITSPLLLKII